MYDPTTRGRSNVLTRNLGLCDPKTNQHVLIFPSVLIHNSAAYYYWSFLSHLIYTCVRPADSDHQIRAYTFIHKGSREYRHPCCKAYITRQTHLSWSYETPSTSQLNRWCSEKIQRLARAKILFLSICASLRSTTITSVPPLLVILPNWRPLPSLISSASPNRLSS